MDGKRDLTWTTIESREATRLRKEKIELTGMLERNPISKVSALPQQRRR